MEWEGYPNEISLEIHGGLCIEVLRIHVVKGIIIARLGMSLDLLPQYSLPILDNIDSTW